MIILTRKERNLPQRRRRAYTFRFSGGFRSGVETANLLKTLAHKYKTDPAIRETALEIIENVPSRDQLREVKAIFRWIRDNIRFVPDAYGTEGIQIPTLTLPHFYSEHGWGQGDCDDQVLLLATMLLSIGIGDIKFRIVTFKPDDNEWKHIYLMIRIAGNWYAADPIVDDRPFGYEHPHLAQEDITV